MYTTEYTSSTFMLFNNLIYVYQPAENIISQHANNFIFIYLTLTDLNNRMFSYYK